MLGRIALTRLDRTGPTLWSHMRLCLLRGAFAASRAAERFVLHDPRAWLGTAFHKVMEAAAQPDTTAEALEQTWTAAVAEAAAAAKSHPLDARYAAPDRWPGYFLVRQRAMSSAQRVAGASAGRARTVPHGGGVYAERLLSARGGRLAGRPDRFDGASLPNTSLRSPMQPGPARRRCLKHSAASCGSMQRSSQKHWAAGR